MSRLLGARPGPARCYRYEPLASHCPSNAIALSRPASLQRGIKARSTIDFFRGFVHLEVFVYPNLIHSDTVLSARKIHLQS